MMYPSSKKGLVFLPKSLFEWQKGIYQSLGRCLFLYELPKLSEAWVTKLKEEMDTLRTIAWELEAWIIKKDEVITKKRTRVNELEAKLGDVELKVLIIESHLRVSDSKLRTTNSKLRATKEHANSNSAQAVEEYKASKAFFEELVESSMEAYQVRFTECKDKVAQAFSELDMSNIINVETNEGEGEGKATEETTEGEARTKAESIGIKAVTSKGHVIEMTTNV